MNKFQFFNYWNTCHISNKNDTLDTWNHFIYYKINLDRFISIKRFFKMSFWLFEAFFEFFLFFSLPASDYYAIGQKKQTTRPYLPWNSNHFILKDTATGNISHTNFFYGIVSLLDNTGANDRKEVGLENHWTRGWRKSQTFTYSPAVPETRAR